MMHVAEINFAVCVQLLWSLVKHGTITWPPSQASASNRLSSLLLLLMSNLYLSYLIYVEPKS